MITIRASLFPAVVGASPYLTPYDAWKCIKYNAELPTTEAMEIGTLLEDDILELYERKHNVTLVNHQLSVVKDIFSATIDAYDVVNNCIVEAKTSIRRVSELPLHYRLQVQLQMYCHDIRKVVVSYLSAMRYLEFEEEYDSVFLMPYLEKAREFYQKYIIGPEEPQRLVEKEYSDIIWTDNVSVADDDVLYIVNRCKEIEQQLEQLEDGIETLKEEYDKLYEELVVKLDGAQSVVDSTGKVIVERCIRIVPGRLDVALVKSKFPDIYHQCYRPKSERYYYRIV
ncbi:MAG: YqaJ viral recombinase family protein [Candidatus Caldarchaeum sp.]